MKNNKVVSIEGKQLIKIVEELFAEEENFFDPSELSEYLKVNSFTSKLTEINSESEMILKGSAPRIKYLIDHFSVTFISNKDLLRALISLFEINCWKEQKNSSKEYKYSYQNKGITISFNPPLDPAKEYKPSTYDKGICVVLPGSVCNFENLNKFFGFTEYFQERGFLKNICRFDLAFDVFNDEYHNFKKVINHYDTNRICKQIKGSAIFGEDLKDYPELPSRSIYFGLTKDQLDKDGRNKEKAPNKYVTICIYDKKAEKLSKSKNPAVLFPSLPESWTRFEIRLKDKDKKNKNATTAFNRLKENRSLRELIQDAFTTKINFHKKNPKSKRDSKLKWWSNLTGEGIRYFLPPKYKAESQIDEVELRNRFEKAKNIYEEFTGKQFEIKEKAG